MVRLDFCLGPCPEELLDTLVPEALYHPYSVYYRYTRSKRPAERQGEYYRVIAHTRTLSPNDEALRRTRALEDRKQIRCKKIFAVPGNHDKQIRKLTEEFSWLSNLAEISIHGQPIVICHYAMRVWNRSHHGAWHLYGHSHGNLPDAPTSLSMYVGVDTHDFRPWHFDEISTIMAGRVKKQAAPEHPSQSSIHG